MSVNNDYDTIVLSGGSTKGILILGALQCAYDNFLLQNIKTYIGTSAGSMICYLLSIGYTPVEIMVYLCTNQVLEKMQSLDMVGLLQGRGACSFTIIQEHLEKMTISKIGYLPTLEDIKEKFNKTIVCVTHNLTEEKTEYLSYETHPKLPCITAIRMSSNLPLVFEIFKYGNSMYIDGGISDNFAVDVAEKMGEKVLGLTVNSNISSNTDYNSMNINFIYKLIFIPINQATKYKINNTSSKSTIVNIKTSDNIKIFNFDIDNTTKLEMFSQGYEQMKTICS